MVLLLQTSLIQIAAYDTADDDDDDAPPAQPFGILGCAVTNC
jgi:hypothetical protein